VNDPFERLTRSHRRLEERLEDLERGAREKNVATLRDVCAFLDRQVRRHEADEEGSLFPRIAKTTNETLRVLAERLAREHRTHEALHARLERATDALERDDDATDLAGAADAITVAYRAHLREEEQTLFPLTRSELTSEELAAMAREMDERRGR